MSEQHTPGLLTLLPGSKTTIYTADEHEMFVASCGTGEKQRNRETRENARRLVACWNLLVDVPTKEIEAAANYGAAWGKTGLELAAVTAKLEQLRTENARLLAELEAVGAGGVQPLRAKAGWVLVPVEPTLEMLEAMHTACLCFYEDDQRAAYHAMLAATPVPRPARRNPQGTTAPQQEKPELRVGQVWRTLGGQRVIIKSKTTNPKYPFLCVTDDNYYPWTVTEDGMYWNFGMSVTEDLIELISDVPQEGGDA